MKSPKKTPLKAPKAEHTSLPQWMIVGAITNAWCYW